MPYEPIQGQVIVTHGGSKVAKMPDFNLLRQYACHQRLTAIMIIQDNV